MRSTRKSAISPHAMILACIQAIDHFLFRKNLVVMKEPPRRNSSDKKLRGVRGPVTIGHLPIKTNHGHKQKTSIKITANGEKISAIQFTFLNLVRNATIYTSKITFIVLSLSS
jgi:hypothetical protein